MIQNLKSLIVVLVLAAITFALIRPICLRFMDEATFLRRRNVWFVLTTAGFVLPNFWLYALVAFSTLIWAGRREQHPTGLFLMLLHVIPPIGFHIPAIGIEQLFPLDNYRILSLAVLLPALLRARQQREYRPPASAAIPDVLILVYAAMIFFAKLQYETLTNCLRELFVLWMDALLVYYAFSRTCRTRAALTDAMAAFAMACALHAPVAAVESIRGWLLYEGIGEAWGSPIAWAYLMRGDTLRAQASVGHALALGYTMAIGFGFWLYLLQKVPSKRDQWIGALWMWVGLLAAYSRGPWMVAALAFFAFVALGPKAMGRLVKVLTITAVVAAAALSSPIGDAIIDRLPFVGTIDSGNVEYRQRLAELSWVVIQMNPIFGNLHALAFLEELRQGQGIIDLVNVYISVTLFHGYFGSFIFFGFFIVSGLQAYLRMRRYPGHSVDDSLLGASLVGCMIATMLMLGVGSFGTVLAVMYWALGGLAVAYAALPRAAEVIEPKASPGWRPQRASY